MSKIEQIAHIIKIKLVEQTPLEQIAQSIYDLLFTQECPKCKGGGEIQDLLAWDIPNAKQKCPDCKGTGEVLCPVCKGSGNRYLEIGCGAYDCPFCHGSGFKPRFVELADDQEVPTNEGEEWAMIYRAAQLSMTTPKDDTVWMKVKTGGK